MKLRTAEDALRKVNENFIKLDEDDKAQSNQIVDFLKNDVVSTYLSDFDYLHMKGHLKCTTTTNFLKKWLERIREHYKPHQ